MILQKSLNSWKYTLPFSVISILSKHTTTFSYFLAICAFPDRTFTSSLFLFLCCVCKKFKSIYSLSTNLVLAPCSIVVKSSNKINALGGCFVVPSLDSCLSCLTSQCLWRNCYRRNSVLKKSFDEGGMSAAMLCWRNLKKLDYTSWPLKFLKTFLRELLHFGYWKQLQFENFIPKLFLNLLEAKTSTIFCDPCRTFLEEKSE